MEIDTTKKYGVKISILSQMDYSDYAFIIEAIRSLGYMTTIIDNGNTICEK